MNNNKSTFDLKTLVRQNIWNLTPYSSARDEFQGNAVNQNIFLDANENPIGIYNRYPDPNQGLLKKKIAEIKKISPENIFIGNGSDEIIDLVVRIFCEPGIDKAIICSPTYGMYEVAAAINNVSIIDVPLNDEFQLELKNINEKSAKCIFLCSPNNPTGNILKDVEHVVVSFPGIVVIDEAYIDFSHTESFLHKLDEYPNLIVMQTFSKAWALAGIRIGVAYAGKEIIKIMSKTKAPYNVSSINQKEAIRALENKQEIDRQIATIIIEREKLVKELDTIKIVRKVYPSDANFVLIETYNATALYNYLVSKNIITRNRHSICPNTLRITVGTVEENIQLINEIKIFSNICTQTSNTKTLYSKI